MPGLFNKHLRHWFIDAFIHWVIISFRIFKTLSIPNRQSWELNVWENVLETPWSFSQSVSNLFPPYLQKIITPKPLELSNPNIWDNVHYPLCVTCNMSHVTICVSHVMCQVPHVIFFLIKQYLYLYQKSHTQETLNFSMCADSSNKN